MSSPCAKVSSGFCSPTLGYPSLDPYRHVCLGCAVQNGIHAFDHRLLQPALGLFTSVLVTLDDYLIVTQV
jgi:hypothetical protein